MIQTYLPQYVRGKTQDPSFAKFANGLGRAVYYELVSNGWYTPERYNNIMSQLSGESGHGTSGLAKTNHNYGGRKSKNGGWMMFKDDADFAKNQVAYIRRRPRMWNAKNIIDFAKAAKSYNYFGADLNKYIKLMQNQTAARSAWESAMKGWGNQVPNKPSLPQNDVNNLDNSTNKTALDYLNDEYRNDTNNMIPAAVLAVTPDEHPLTQSLDDNIVKNDNMPEIGDLFAAALAGQQYLPTPLLGYDNYSQQLPGDAKGKDSVGTYNNPIALDPVVVFPDRSPEKTLDQKAKENYEYQKEHPFLSNIRNNVTKLKDEWDKFWDSNLFRYPAYMAIGGGVGRQALKFRSKFRAANRYKVPVNSQKSTYVIDPWSDLVGDILGAYGKFQQTPVGALLPFKYGKDSGIHINPANRGKFNATKRRTGKTTEELTHSKNPLTRKRAIFAMNARKWKH